jgi:hypothetical protein
MDFVVRNQRNKPKSCSRYFVNTRLGEIEDFSNDQFVGKNKITIHVPVMGQEVLFKHEQSSEFTLKHLLCLFQHDLYYSIANW